MTTTQAYLTLNLGPATLGTLRLVLHSTTVPRTVSNFVSLLDRPPGSGYVESTFHRIIRGFMAQGGDFTKGDGTGGTSIYGPSFPDENFVHSHDRRGALSMANSGPNTNGSQFFVTFKSTPHLDGRHVVFGYVDVERDEESRRVLDALERVTTSRGNDRPVVPVTIVECGVLSTPEEKKEEAQPVRGVVTAEDKAKAKAAADDDEIDLDEEDDEGDVGERDGGVAPLQERHPEQDGDEIDLDEDNEPPPPPPQEEEDDGAPKKGGKKASALRQRLRALKMKMNQGRQLNRREVQAEGERLGSDEAVAKEKRRQAKEDRARRAKEWEESNGKAIGALPSDVAGGESAVDAKYLSQQAADSMRKAAKKAEKAQANRFGVDDYWNPEGQHRNYERNLRTVSASGARGGAAAADGATYDPTAVDDAGTAHDAAASRGGAKRLADELRRRAEKSAERKRKQVDFEAADVSYVNQRNKRFNEKIGRTFDKHTAEIRQNLERGTAL